MASDIASVPRPGQPVNKKNLILIVDDEIDMSTILELSLQLDGFDTEAASNGREALELAIKLIPDLIISDCMMPFMTGPEMLRQLRALPSTRNIPCILMSAAPERHNLTITEQDHFLQKPFRFEALMDKINTLLKIETD